jgi:hypothetical protein
LCAPPSTPDPAVSATRARHAVVAGRTVVAELQLVTITNPARPIATQPRMNADSAKRAKGLRVPSKIDRFLPMNPNVAPTAPRTNAGIPRAGTKPKLKAHPVRPHTNLAVANGAPRLQPVRPQTNPTITNKPSNSKCLYSAIAVPPGSLSLPEWAGRERCELGALPDLCFFFLP